MAEMAEERQYEEIEAPQQTSEAAETVQEVQSDDDGTMSLIAHLTELRSRLIKCLIAVGLGSCVGYYFIEEIMHYLTLPAGKLTAKERMVLGIVVPTSVVLFFSGLAFSFFLVLPAGIRFFMGFGNAELEALFSVNKYFDFVITFVLPFGFVFELPLVITILGKMGILTSAMLKKYQRIVIFLSFVAGAIITPTPDVFTQSMIALPMIVLYEVGYFIVRFILRR